eukprot:scaffold10214_cov111-Isochrysis_galbana.AAC.1
MSGCGNWVAAVPLYSRCPIELGGMCRCSPVRLTRTSARGGRLGLFLLGLALCAKAVGAGSIGTRVPCSRLPKPVPSRGS